MLFGNSNGSQYPADVIETSESPPSPNSGSVKIINVLLGLIMPHVKNQII